MSNRSDLCQIREQMQQLEARVRAVHDRLGARSAATHLDKASNLIAGSRSLVTEALRQRVDDADVAVAARQ